MPRLLVPLLIAVFLPPPWALAQTGVFVDPDSPAGKEYALPLEEARRENSGDPSGGESESGRGLFGVGIERVNRASGGEVGGRSALGPPGASGETDEGAASGGNGETPGAEDLGPNVPSTAPIEAAADDGSDALLTAGIAAAVLGVGLLAGFGLRTLFRGG